VRLPAHIFRKMKLVEQVFPAQSANLQAVQPV
jgi:hypothetical protein